MVASQTYKTQNAHVCTELQLLIYSEDMHLIRSLNGRVCLCIPGSVHRAFSLPETFCILQFSVNPPTIRIAKYYV
jgi:hypothetical protein